MPPAEVVALGMGLKQVGARPGRPDGVRVVTRENGRFLDLMPSPSSSYLLPTLADCSLLRREAQSITGSLSFVGDSVELVQIADVVPANSWGSLTGATITLAGLGAAGQTTLNQLTSLYQGASMGGFAGFGAGWQNTFNQWISPYQGASMGGFAGFGAGLQNTVNQWISPYHQWTPPYPGTSMGGFAGFGDFGVGWQNALGALSRPAPARPRSQTPGTAEFVAPTADADSRSVATESLPVDASIADIASRIAALSGLSDELLAELFKVERETFCRWRTGALTNPRVGNRRRLALLLGLVDDLAARQVSIKDWLLNSVTPEGFTPYDLLERGRIDEVAFLSASIGESPVARDARVVTGEEIEPLLFGDDDVWEPDPLDDDER